MDLFEQEMESWFERMLLEGKLFPFHRVVEEEEGERE